MTAPVTMPRTGKNSFALGLLLATITVLLSHCLMYLLVAAAFDNYVLEPLFSATFFSGLLFVILAGVASHATLSSRRKHHLTPEVSAGKTVGWTFLLVVFLSTVFAIIMAATELGGLGMPVVLFALLHGIPALLLAIVISPVGTMLHRNMFHSESVPAQRD